MEFIGLDQMCRLVRPAGWSRKDVLRALEIGQLTGIKIEQPRTNNPKWAIVHPGVQFLDYIKNKQTRLRSISILSEDDVAAILGRNRAYVRWLVRSGKIQSTVTKYEKGRRQRRWFTIESVRQFIIASEKRDPLKRQEPTAEIMVAWFLRAMNVEPKVTGPEVIDEELSWIDSMPEPERSQYIDRLFTLAEQARDKLAEQCESKFLDFSEQQKASAVKRWLIFNNLRRAGPVPGIICSFQCCSCCFYIASYCASQSAQVEQCSIQSSTV